MGISILVEFDELRELLVGGANLTLSNAFQELRTVSGQATSGSGRLKHNARLLKVINDSSQDVFLSFDGGTTTHDLVPAGGFTLYDFTTNRSNMGGDFLLGEGGFIFAATTTGTAATGFGVTATIVYGKGNNMSQAGIASIKNAIPPAGPVDTLTGNTGGAVAPTGEARLMLWVQLEKL